MQRNISAAELVQQLLSDNANSFLVSRRFLRERLLLYVAARYGVAGAIFFGAWFASQIVGIGNLPVTKLQFLAFLLALYNTIVFAVLYFPSWNVSSGHHYLTLLMHLTISIDFFFLTFALWLVGGAASPFASFYVLHIILAALLLPRWGVVLQALIGYGMFAGLVILQWLQVIPLIYPEGAILAAAPMDWRYAATLLTAQAVLLLVTGGLVTEISAALKRGESALSELNNELQRLSEMRRDFMHVITHNLKAPAAAATMLLESVESLWPVEGSSTAREAIRRARMRTQELGQLIQDMQQLVALESGALREHETTLNLNTIAQQLKEEYQDAAAEKRLTVELVLEDSLPDVRAVPRLIHEAAANYITNAIKYTPEAGHIVIRTRHEGTEVLFEVEDSGVGVPAEHLPNLFGEFVRAPTLVSGKRPPGIGLGLSIVKRILEYYGGHVYVTSTVGKGSTFGFAMPTAKSQELAIPSAS